MWGGQRRALARRARPPPYPPPHAGEGREGAVGTLRFAYPTVDVGPETTMIIATAGHVDHGKTSLVRALTGIDTDRLPEEKARGLTIDIGFAYVPLPDGGLIGFVDVPGHQRFIKNMLAGVGNVDRALLVVAADDGVMPQTVEHVEILDLLGVAHATVAITKVDKVGTGRSEEVEVEIRTLLGHTGIAVEDVFRTSVRTNEGVAPLRARIAAVAQAHGPPPPTGRFRLAVDRAFILHG